MNHLKGCTVEGYYKNGRKNLLVYRDKSCSFYTLISYCEVYLFIGSDFPNKFSYTNIDLVSVFKPEHEDLIGPCKFEHQDIIDYLLYLINPLTEGEIKDFMNDLLDYYVFNYK